MKGEVGKEKRVPTFLEIDEFVGKMAEKYFVPYEIGGLRGDISTALEGSNPSEPVTISYFSVKINSSSLDP